MKQLLFIMVTIKKKKMVYINNDGLFQNTKFPSNFQIDLVFSKACDISTSKTLLQYWYLKRSPHVKRREMLLQLSPLMSEWQSAHQLTDQRVQIWIFFLVSPYGVNFSRTENQKTFWFVKQTKQNLDACPVPIMGGSRLQFLKFLYWERANSLQRFN